MGQTSPSDLTTEAHWLGSVDGMASWQPISREGSKISEHEHREGPLILESKLFAD